VVSQFNLYQTGFQLTRDDVISNVAFNPTGTVMPAKAGIQTIFEVAVKPNRLLPKSQLI
jgi:hypothetical protein